MNRKLYLEKMKTAKDKVDFNWIIDVTKKSIDTSIPMNFQRGERCLIIVMEELSELQVEISKSIIGEGDELGILEELSDVILGLIYVEEIYQIPVSIDNFNRERSCERSEQILITVIQKLSELQKAISKSIRGEGCLIDIQEKWSDVFSALIYIYKLYIIFLIVIYVNH